MSICQHIGCGKNAAGYSKHCTAHRIRDRRHGAADQETITAAKLRPYVRAVRAWVARQPDDSLWQKLEGILNALLDRARAVDAEFAAGRPGLRHEVQAVHDLLKVTGAVPAQKIIETVLAMIVMQEREPRRFKSDRASRVQLARRVRGLSDLFSGSYWNHRDNRVHLVYRDPDPRAAEALGQMLMEALGVAGAKINAADLADLERLPEAKKAFYVALAASREEVA